MTITTIGIDLAKNVFLVHGVDERGHVALKKQVRREQLTAFMVNLPPCEVGWKWWSPTDRVIYDLEDEDGTTTEGVVLAGVSGGSGQAGRADRDVD